MAKLNNSAPTVAKKTSKKGSKLAPPRPQAAKGNNVQTDNEETDNEETDRRLPRFRREEVKFRNIAARLEKQSGYLAQWNASLGVDLDSVRSNMAQAKDLMLACAEELAKLPDNYMPRQGRPGTSAKGGRIVEGAKVKVRTDRHEKYEGMLPLDEEFEVLGFRKRNIKVKTSEGPLFVPRGDLMLV